WLLRVPPGRLCRPPSRPPAQRRSPRLRIARPPSPESRPPSCPRPSLPTCGAWSPPPGSAASASAARPAPSALRPILSPPPAWSTSSRPARSSRARAPVGKTGGAAGTPARHCPRSVGFPPIPTTMAPPPRGAPPLLLSI
ncbi:MAG: hypothetical protein AVDCRST_MAG19-3695, partial [uncultured Thermomicrobiales bacterium]